MATNFVAKFAKLADQPSIVALEFRNILEYRNADPSTSCKNLVSFGPVA